MSTREDARKIILKAITGYHEGEPLPRMPRQVRLGSSEKLSRDQIMVGADALRLTLDLTSANSGGRNLYELIDLYLRNREAADAINEVLSSYGKQINQWHPAASQS